MLLVSDKTQQMVFVSEVLPSLFHDTPEQFIRLLARDGNKFLRFYWDQAGKQFEESKRVSSFGLNYDLRKPGKNVGVVLITLPKPQVVSEAYFVALIYRPYRVTPILRISDITTVVALEYFLDKQGEPDTLLVEWTRKLMREEISKGPAPLLNEFYKAICDLITGK
jgi:hypothetical protein